ncbi:MAG: DUF2147 domain-containing protein [Arachidicoccus sp.]|nr:DUF2147 domain-containing protein [Arachidicoccus sp.]
MKSLKIFLLLSFTMLMIHSYAQKVSIEGTWFNEEKDGKIEIYKAKDGKYYGKLIWIKDPIVNGKPKLDDKNSDESLRNRELVGLLILKSFSADGDIFSGGTIYDPKSGKTYSCKITPKNNNTLSIRGYIGISLFGRTTVWTRTTN